MAGDWLKFEIATSDKPEIWLIAGSLSVDPDAVVGKMLRVWAWFDQHSLNGNAPSVTKSLLDRLVGVSGFCECIISAGWMVENDGEISLPNFDRHNGKTAKDRALTAKRVAKHKVKCANAKLTDDTLPKEEKRREENTDKDLFSESKEQKKDRIDYAAIIDLYHKILPELPRVSLITEKRRRAIRTCSKIKPSYSTIEFWEAFFEQVRKSDWLMGRKDPTRRAGIDFLTKPEYFIKVIEGAYT